MEASTVLLPRVIPFGPGIINCYGCLQMAQVNKPDMSTGQRMMQSASFGLSLFFICCVIFFAGLERKICHCVYQEKGRETLDIVHMR